MNPRDTLLDLLHDFFLLDGEFLIYDDGYRSWRRAYRQVGNASKALAIRLRAAGVAKGDRVIIWSENRPEWIVGLYGCLLAGAVAVPVDYRSSIEFVERVSRVTDAKVLLRGEEPGPAEANPTVHAWPLTAIEWPDRDVAFEPAAAARDDLCQVIFTSGATAEPKGVTITHGNLLANLVPVEKEIAKYQRYARPFQPLRILNLLPLSHLFGQVMAAFIPPMIPAQVVFMHGFSPKEIVRQIKTRRISVVVSVPMILELLRSYAVESLGAAIEPPVKGHWLRRWWVYRRLHRALGWKFWAFIVGAAPLDPELEGFWSKRGYLVNQGYGLTETAPIVTLNHPFHASPGSVGKPMPGVEVRIAEDGEILVRGENVSKGYYGMSPGEGVTDGWLHTGDIGSQDQEGRLHIRGRKKEMIVTPEGLNVFPEDIERVLNRQPGVRDSAIIGDHRPHAVLVLDEGADPAMVVREANARLEPHQQIRDFDVWPDDTLPHTEGTSKLKRREIQDRLAGRAPTARPPGDGFLAGLINRPVQADTTLSELGLSSLERVELLTKLDIDESALANARTVGDLRRLAGTSINTASATTQAATMHQEAAIKFPEWTRSLAPRALRRLALPFFLLPLLRVFAHVKPIGRSHVEDLRGPVVFASNHQSLFDNPVILAALPPRYRYRLATAMSREFFQAYFHPQGHSIGERFRYGLEYFLACLCFNAFPLPQREAGARESLRYMGELAAEGWSVLIFPEGDRTRTGEILPFQPGVGLIAVKTGLRVVPVRLVGLERVLHRSARFPTPGPVEVRFGKVMTFSGTDYAAIAQTIEAAVRDL